MFAVFSVYSFTDAPAANTQKQQNLMKINQFTGRIIGKNVRMRTAADVDSPIVTEMKKDELVVVTGEKSDFYAVEAPIETKAYIFRSFVLDGVVEGDRVNVRLSPDRDAPVIAHLSTGAPVEGKICEKNNKWLEITIPASTNFYVAKEFVEYAGGPEYKLAHDKRRMEVQQLLESTSLLTQAEMRKPYSEVNMKRLETNYETVINKYTDFPREVEQAKAALTALQENYLQKKISYLEDKAKLLSKNVERRASLVENEAVVAEDMIQLSATDRMKVWEPLEESLFLTWSAMHHAKNMDDFYEDQKLKAHSLIGLVEAFSEPVHNRPGDYILKQNNVPVAYIYSTQTNLQDYVGKQVSLRVSERPNNNFAFPAYYVLDVE